MINKPKPVWVTTQEGGEYIPWRDWTLNWEDPGSRRDTYGFKFKHCAHSIGFDDGSVFDCCGGWRKWSPELLPIDVRMRLGLAKPNFEILINEIARLRKEVSELKNLRPSSLGQTQTQWHWPEDFWLS